MISTFHVWYTQIWVLFARFSNQLRFSTLRYELCAFSKPNSRIKWKYITVFRIWVQIFTDWSRLWPRIFFFVKLERENRDYVCIFPNISRFCLHLTPDLGFCTPDPGNRYPWSGRHRSLIQVTRFRVIPDCLSQNIIQNICLFLYCSQSYMKFISYIRNLFQPQTCSKCS